MNEVATSIQYYLDRRLIDLPNEKWVDVFGFENTYSVSSFGRVKGKNRLSRCGRYDIKEKILVQTISDSETLLVALFEKKYSVTRVIVSSFLRKPIEEIFTSNKICVHHKNLNPFDNFIDNLEITDFGVVHKKVYKLGISGIEAANIVSKENAKKRADLLNIYSSGILVERVCKKCLEQLPIENFRWDGANRFTCKRCKFISMGVMDIGRSTKANELKKSGLRTCYTCKETKSIDFDFHKNTFKCKCCSKKKISTTPIN